MSSTPGGERRPELMVAIPHEDEGAEDHVRYFAVIRHRCHRSASKNFGFCPNHAPAPVSCMGARRSMTARYPASVA